jgi:aspartyl-tRNA(Asn)/glutamyl-tRNA(Gln) amidotransferase subunit A
LGSDTGGSIRQPAALCNVVGLKPTYGRVTRHGLIAFASSLDQAGPLTRDVRDAALVLGALAGPDPLDATAADVPVPDYLAACERGLRNVRVGIHRRALDRDGIDPSVRAAFMTALDRLRAGGAQLVDIELPHFEFGIAAYYVISPAEAASNLARYDGVRYGLRLERDRIDAMYEATRQAGFGAEVKRRLMLGTYVLRKDAYEAYYGRAQRVRTLVARDYTEAFRDCDVIASPTSPVAGIRRGERVDDPLTMYLADVFTVGASLAGLPAISIPCGFSAAHGHSLPIGLQLIAPRFHEEALLAVATAYEDGTDWHRHRPPGFGS